MGSSGPAQFDVRKVAIVGAGPCGLSAAKYLRAQGTFDTIVIFEKQDEVGGVWNYSDLAPSGCPFPQEDPFYPPDAPIQLAGDGAPIFPSPMYNKLHANIPGSLMNFSDQQFPSNSWVFPSREDIQDYLLTYSRDVKDLIKFGCKVEKISLQPKDGRDRWLIEAQTVVGNQRIRDTYDAVVVANGHYSVPFIPDISNMQRFNEAFPPVISHSKQYRTAEAFRNKKVVVVGNGPSGLDIALQINQVCRQPALLSTRQPTPQDKLEHTGCEETSEIQEFLIEQRGVRFKDGRVETDIDEIIFGTGFLFSFPFLPDLQHKLLTTGNGVHGLYKHLFHIQHPTLVFPGLNMKAVPWPLSEAQAAVFSAVWSNNIELPAIDEMERWSRELFAHQGEALHIFKPTGDGFYINELHDWAKKATYLGKVPPRWNDEMFWQRRTCVEAKLRFERQGCKATTLAELGLHYEPGSGLGSEQSAPEGP